MIDLDKAQHDAGWEPRFKVGGVIVRMAHPSTVKVADERRGLLPSVARFASRLWRLVVGGSETAALRKAVLECVEAFDGETARAVVCMSAWDLGRLYGAYQEAARGVLAKTVRGAFEGSNEAALKAPSAGAHRQSTAVSPPGERPSSGTGAGAGAGGFPLKTGERLPYFLGGARWGRDVAVGSVAEQGTQNVNEQKEQANG